MATYLQLVNSLERESGTVDASRRLTTVVGARGRQQDFVFWIAEAWRIIQVMRGDWRFLRREFEGPVIANKARYTAAELGLVNFSGWPGVDVEGHGAKATFTIFDPAVGRTTERELFMYCFNDWKAVYDRRTHDPNTPIRLAVDYEDKLCFGPTPDKAYTVRGEYYRSPQDLVADVDVPIIQPHYHNMILWRAMMLYGEHEQDVTAVVTAKSKFDAQYRQFVNKVQPSVRIS